MHIHSQSKAQRKGIALIAVLWVVAFLSTMLVVTLTLLKVDVDDNVAEVHSFRAWQMAHTGLSYGLHPKVKRDDPILESREDGYDEGFSVTIEPEAGRMNINQVLKANDRSLLFNLFKEWGLEDDVVDQLIDALVDWVDADQLKSLNGAEYDYYRELGYLDRPYNRAFRELDEMQLVRGFGALENLQPNWREFFTVWSRGAIDIHEASPDVLSVAAEVDPIAANAYYDLVVGEDGRMGTEDDVRFQSVHVALDELTSPVERREVIASRFTLKGEILRIKSVGRSGDYRSEITAISGAKSGRSNLLDYQEKQVVSE